MQVALETRDKLVMPTVVEVRYADGSARRINVAVETWRQHAKTGLTLPGGPPVVSATVDPDHRLPDRDRSDDTFRLGGASAN